MCFTSLWKYSWINQVAVRWHQINWSRLLFTALLKRRDLERLDSGFVGPPRRSERLEWGGSRRHFLYCVLFFFFLQLYSFNAYILQFRTRLYKNSRSGGLDCKIWNSQTRSPFIYIAAQCVNDTFMQFVWQCCSCFLSEVLVQLSDNNSSSDWSARVDVCVCVWLFFFRGGMAVCCWDGQADTSSVSCELNLLCWTTLASTQCCCCDWIPVYFFVMQRRFKISSPLHRGALLYSRV